MQLDLRPLRPVSEREALAGGLPFHTPAVGTQPQTTGFAWWGADEIQQLCTSLGLPPNGPLSALAVEVLPEPNGYFEDPLGGDLGHVRVLRSSPLTAIPDGCCTGA